VKSDVKKLLKKNEQLNQLDSIKVTSHVQRESGDWIKNTLMLEGYSVPQVEIIAGMEFEFMKVVRIRRS